MRKAALARHRAELAQALGASAFAKLEQALLQKHKAGPQATAAGPVGGH